MAIFSQFTTFRFRLFGKPFLSDDFVIVGVEQGDEWLKGAGSDNGGSLVT